MWISINVNFEKCEFQKMWVMKNVNSKIMNFKNCEFRKMLKMFARHVVNIVKWDIFSDLQTLWNLPIVFLQNLQAKECNPTQFDQEQQEF